ncbi:MAG: NAD(P)/FAD-dependent oxidoreductase [Candidatus Hodarchaeales archaeon]|jgi:nitrite reductase (NADH) large subunit
MQVVIIGSGHAAITAVNTFLQNQADIEITMITEDRFPFYPRPSIYRIILGKSPEEIITYPENWYREKNISLQLNTHISNIDTTGKKVLTTDNKHFSYDKLLIATGSKPFIPPIPGLADGPVYCLRSIDDAITIRERVNACVSKKATILGGGLLSVELAKTLSDIGVIPTIIDRSPYLLRKQLDQEGGHFFNNVLDKAFNTRFLFNMQCRQVYRDDDKIRMKIEDPTGISDHNCELLLNATGIMNDNTLPRSAGILLGKYAIQVDPFMRTSLKNVYAAGDAVDIGYFPGSKFGIIPTAMDQAKIAALNILGNEVPYTGTVPWTSLKVAGIPLVSMGNISIESGVQEECIIRDFDAGIYRKLFFKGNKLRGAIQIGTRENMRQLKSLTTQQASIEQVKKELS